MAETYQPKLNKDAVLQGYLGRKIADPKKIGMVRGYKDGLKVLKAISNAGN